MCVCVYLCSGHSLVFWHYWVINIILQHGCDQSLLVGEALDVYHTCLRPKQQAGSTNKHQRMLCSLAHTFSLFRSLSLMSPLSSSITFSISPASLDLPLSLSLMQHSRCVLKKHCSWCGMSVNETASYSPLRFWLQKEVQRKLRGCPCT